MNPTTIKRFRRAMRRHERRARKWSADLAGTLQAIRAAAERNPEGRAAGRPASWARSAREFSRAPWRPHQSRDFWRREAWILERAADTCARLRAASLAP